MFNHQTKTNGAGGYEAPPASLHERLAAIEDSEARFAPPVIVIEPYQPSQLLIDLWAEIEAMSDDQLLARLKEIVNAERGWLNAMTDAGLSYEIRKRKLTVPARASLIKTSRKKNGHSVE